MFKTTRWKTEKNKIKVVFKLQFQAAQVPLPGSSEAVVVSLVPQDVGRATARSEMAAVVDGACVWSNPIYETAKMVRDPKSGKMIEKMYQFLISVAGSGKNVVLGEATVNLADYVEVFKASSVSFHLKAGTILHVTIQRMQGDVANREAEENGDGWGRQRQRTLQSQLSKYDNEKGLKALIGRNDLSLVKDGAQLNREPRVFPSTRNPPSHAESKAKLHKSYSSGAISPSSSGSSSEIYTPKENTTSNGSNQNESEAYIEKLTSDVVFLSKKIESSELELQSLRKQNAKESRQAQDLSRERDALLREREQLKLSQNMTNLDDSTSAESALEEIKQELDHERNLNSSLRLQLQKTQEANSELLLAVRDLDELLMEEKRRDVFCSQCSKKYLKDQEHRESYENEREELVIQIEQLAFELEILRRRENEDKCSEHLAIISDLQGHAEFLEAKLQAQAMSFESDAHNIIQERVEQENKATQVEETLQKTRWNVTNTCDRLHEEIARLSSHASSVFFANERIIKKALKEASELRSQKVHLEELLRKTEEDMGALKGRYSMDLQKLLELFVSKSHEADTLLLKLKEKNEELEDRKKSEEELQLLRVEIEKLRVEKPSKEIEMMTREMEALTKQNEAAEAELREMQERYSETSVKFAEVEGERQRLMITIRNLKNALKN